MSDLTKMTFVELQYRYKTAKESRDKAWRLGVEAIDDHTTMRKIKNEIERRKRGQARVAAYYAKYPQHPSS